MCGIVGSVATSSSDTAKNAESYRRALDTLAHRGPDQRGQYSDGRLWLGHTRLSILDLSSAGSQPMRSPGGRFVIVHNGEVYNFRELKVEHGIGGLHSRSDTEVILRLFEKEGPDSLKHLNGMFAFAIYDTQLNRLWLVRDRLGIKPLYYRWDGESFTFASEVKALNELSKRRPAFDSSALHEWLYFGNSLGQRTLYNDVNQLLPGHYLHFDINDGQIGIEPYWALPTVSAGRPVGVNIVAETRRLLESAVRRQLVSDVPVGLFLSGGIDSTAIAAFASRHYPRLATYSVGFRFDKGTNELPMAKRVATHYGTDHTEFYIDGKDMPQLVDKMIACHDMPFSDAANIPLYLMAMEVRNSAKVVLQGDGGDEIFGGYRRYATLTYYPLLHPLAHMALQVAELLPQSPISSRLRRYFRAFAAPNLAATMSRLLTAEDTFSEPLRIFSDDIARELRKSDPFKRIAELQQRFDSLDVRNQMLFVDTSTILPDIYLQKVDRSTMAASLEVRVPFLDHELVDFATALPGNVKMPYGKKKWLLKAALRGIVPDDILSRPKKGFGVPYGQWLLTSLKPMFFDHLNQFVRNQPGVLAEEHVRMLFRRTEDGTDNHLSLLWKVLNLIVWANRTDISFTNDSA